MTQKLFNIDDVDWQEFVGYVGHGKASVMIRYLIQEYNRAHRPKVAEGPKPMFDSLEGSYLASLKEIQEKKGLEAKNLLKDLIKQEFAVQKDNKTQTEENTNGKPSK